MSRVILETERTEMRPLTRSIAKSIESLQGISKIEAEEFIDTNIEHQSNHDFSVYAVFLKDSGKYIGYCGCHYVTLGGERIPQLTWEISKEYKEDDIDIEVPFAVRNYMFRNFNIDSMVAYISDKDPLGMNIAEEIDMVCEETITESGATWFVYLVNRNSEKFLASFGDGESEPVLNSVQRRRDRMLNPASGLKKPRPTPFK